MNGFDISSHSRGLKEEYKLDIHAHHSADLLVYVHVHHPSFKEYMYIILRISLYVLG